MSDSVTLNSDGQVVVVFSKPNEKDYTCSKTKKCPPILRGEGCFGDCYDCFEMNLERFKGYKKLALKKVSKS